MAIGIQHKGTIIMRMIMDPQARWSIVASTSLDRGLIKRIHQLPRIDPKSNVNCRRVGRAFTDPEVRIALLAKSRDIRMASHSGRKLVQHFIANGTKCSLIKSLT